MQYHAIACNSMQYHAIPCNTLQYHASLITADGAYHCPVGSIMAIFTYQIVALQVASVTKMLYLSSPQEIDSITQLTQPEVEVLVDVTRTAPYNPHSPQVFRTQYLKSETLLNGLLSFEHHILS